MAGDEGGGAAAGDGTGGGEAERCGDEERDEGGGTAAGDGTGGGEAERCGDEERFCFFAPRIVWRRGSLTGSLKGLGVALARGLNPLGANTVL